MNGRLDAAISKIGGIEETRKIPEFPPIQRILPRRTRSELEREKGTGVMLPKPTSRITCVVKSGGVNSNCSKNAKKSQSVSFA